MRGAVKHAARRRAAVACGPAEPPLRATAPRRRSGGIDANGTLYGAASGGDHNHGTLFSLAPSARAYKLAVLAALRSTIEGGNPVNPPALSRDGSLAGATGTYIYGCRNGHLATLASSIPARRSTRSGNS